MHIRAPKYTTMPATANPKAVQPYPTMPVASVQLGATATSSRITSQMHTYGTMLTAIATAESAQPRIVSPRRSPAKLSRRPTVPCFFSSAILLLSKRYEVCILFALFGFSLEKPEYPR